MCRQDRKAALEGERLFIYLCFMGISLRFNRLTMFLGLVILAKANVVIAQEKNQVPFKENRFQESAWQKVKENWAGNQLCAQWDTSQNHYAGPLKLQLNNGNQVVIELSNQGVAKISFWPKNAKQDHLSYAVANALVAETILPEYRDLITDPRSGMQHHANYLFTLINSGQKFWISMCPFRMGLVDGQNNPIVTDDASMPWVEEGHQITHNFQLNDGERFLGLGEKTGPLDRRGNAYTLWNTDCFGYSVDQDPMYVSVPYYVGFNGNIPYGVFVDHSAKSVFNFGAANTRFTSISVMDDHFVYYLLAGNSLFDITQKYTQLTGRNTMPPKWSLGFHQSRWGYQSSTEIEELVFDFRTRNLPLDAVHLDIPYMQDNKVFTFDSVRFKNPKKLVDILQSKGVNTVVILDPGIKVEKGYQPYQTGIKNDLFVKYPDGSFYEAGVWPGNCHFPDFTKQQTRDFWMNEMKFYSQMGVKGYWNDMNEPAAWGKEVPTFIRFYAENHQWDLIKARNIYGFNMAKTTATGATQLLGERPFVLTRAGFAGIQRYSAVWTGDNVASDEHLLLSARLINSMGMSGIGFCGADVGGFSKPATSELYVRWMSLGAFTPFFRAHKTIGMPRSEPWSFGEDNLQIVRYYLQMRYRLMPYLYSSFYQMCSTGMPVNRNLAFLSSNIQNEPQIFNESFQNQFLFGDALLVAPVASTDKLASVYLPKLVNSQRWYHLYTDQLFQPGTEAMVKSPLHALPVFVKGGSILPEFNVTGKNTDVVSDTLVIHLYHTGEEPTVIAEKNFSVNGRLLSSRSTDFVLWEDDGKSVLKQSTDLSLIPSNGIFRKTLLEFHPETRKLNVVSQGGSANYASGYHFVKLVWHGYVNVLEPNISSGKDMRNTMSLKVLQRSNTSFAFSVPMYQTDLMEMSSVMRCYETVIKVEDFFPSKGGTEVQISWK